MSASPADLRTNRDLYCFVGELARRNQGHDRTLESYLRAMRSIVRAGAYGDSLPPGTFAAILVDAFDHPVPSDRGVPDENAPAPNQSASATPGRAAWEACITAQIRDLQEMAAAGTLADKLRYFGIDAPSGARWFNFDPSTYIEAGLVGTFGGWDPEDDTGRTLVPGPVAAIDPATGMVVSVDPAALDRPIVELVSIDWASFTEFLECGAIYE